MSKFFRTLKRSIKSVSKTEYEKRTGKKDWEYWRFELWCSFLDTFYYSWETPIRVFCESCVRTAKWFPIIWKDRHWDHWHILEILKHKIRFQREHIGSANRHTTAQRDAHNMLIAEKLIERIQNSHYGAKDWEEHYQKWPSRFLKMLHTPGYTMEASTESESKDAKRIMDYETYMKNQDYDYLFEHLKKHLEKWWD